MPQSISDERKRVVELSYGSAPLEDKVFVVEFESCRFPNEQFRRADHIRLAWIYIRQYDYMTADERMRHSIHGFASYLGAKHKYHETITIAWMRLVNAAFQLSSRIDKFDDFARARSRASAGRSLSYWTAARTKMRSRNASLRTCSCPRRLPPLPRARRR